MTPSNAPLGREHPNSASILTAEWVAVEAALASLQGAPDQETDALHHRLTQLAIVADAVKCGSPEEAVTLIRVALWGARVEGLDAESPHWALVARALAFLATQPPSRLIGAA